jgi:hypothetical protein
MSDEIDLTKRLGFSEQLLKDCGPGSPADYQRWLWERRRMQVPPDEFWFFVNEILPGSEQTTAAQIKQQVGQGLVVRVLARY